jgi:hypothetical protein
MLLSFESATIDGAEIRHRVSAVCNPPGYNANSTRRASHTTWQATRRRNERAERGGLRSMNRRLAVLVVCGCVGCHAPRAEYIQPLHTPQGIAVAIQPNGENGWEVLVQNDSPGSIQLAWDRSSFVASDGSSLGRLVRAQTPYLTDQHEVYTGYAQPATPIESGARADEWFTPEVFVGKRGAPPAGRLYLVFETTRGEQTWQAMVTPTEPGAVPLGDGFWCVDPGTTGAPSACTRDQLACTHRVADARAAGHDVDRCTTADVAYCVRSARAGAPPIAQCFAQADECTRASSFLHATAGVTIEHECRAVY